MDGGCKDGRRERLGGLTYVIFCLASAQIFREVILSFEENLKTRASLTISTLSTIIYIALTFERVLGPVLLFDPIACY